MSEDSSLPTEIARAMIAGALEPDVPPHQPSSNWEPPTVEALNKILPQYHITQRLGRGGMGAVYQGRQENLDRFVAIKILPTRLAQGPAFVARFQREAKILATLNHPGIITIYDAGQTADGQLYFVMEYVDGTDLSRLQCQPEFSQKDALSLTSQICDALQYAHSRGVLHRDIKPENVMITKSGQVKLADFGLARPMGQQTGDRLTGSHVVMGTPVYMAPEQRVDPDSVDQRADLYALGVMLYEMLTGELPVGKWEPPSRVAAVDSRLDHVIQRALQQEPSLRYSYATEIKRDLDAIRAGELAGFGSWTEGSPFRGLLVFDSQHARIFFGRQQATEAVSQQLHQNHRAGCGFSLIVGSSGVGKSSLARAGVLPRLQQANELGLDFRRLAVFQPKSAANSQNLLRALAEALLANHALPELASFDLTETSLARALAESPVRVVSFMLQALADIESMDADLGTLEEPPPVGLLLLVDQLEEIFTLPWLSDADRKAFCSALKHLAQTGRVWIVATLRSDFFPQCETLPDLMDLKAGLGQYHLDPPREFEMAHIVRWSAHSGGLRFEEKNGERLDDLIIRDAAANPHSLPLLSFALDALYRARSKEGMLLFSEYAALGGLVGGLSQQAEKAYQEFAAQFPSQAEKTFDALCHPLITQKTPQDAPTRNWALLSDLPPDDAAQALVRHFVEARLLTIDGDRIAFAHEAVLTAWTRTKSWLEKNQDFLQIRARVDARMNEGSPLLLGDPMLELAKAQLLANPTGFRAAQKQWINQAIINAESLTRQTTRRRRLAFATLSCLTLVAIGATAWAMQRGRQAETSEAATRELLVAASGSEVTQADRLLAEADNADPKTEGGASLRNQKTEEAMLHLAKAIEFYPGNPIAREKFGWLVATRRDALPSRPVLTIRSKRNVLCAAFSPDDSRIAIASEDSAQVWDVATGNLLTTITHDSPGHSVAFSPDGKSIVTLTKDRTAQVWDAASAKSIMTFRHEADVLYAAFSPDGTRILTTSENAVKVWSVATGGLLTTIKYGRLAYFAAFSPDGKSIVVPSGSKTVRVWDAVTAKSIMTLEHQSDVWYAAFSPDGTRIVTATWDHTTHVWDAATGTALVRLPHENRVESVAMSPDGTRILTTSENRSQVWDAATGGPLMTLNHGRSAAFSSDGSRIVTASGRTVHVWDAGTAKSLVTLKHESAPTTDTFSPDGTRCFVQPQADMARVIDAVTRKLITTIKHPGNVDYAVFSPDGARIITASYGITAVWDALTGSHLATLTSKILPGSASFSPDGTQLIALSISKNAQVWDLATGQPVKNLNHENFVNSAVFSADGSRIATASDDGTAQVWDTSSGKSVATLRHEGIVRSAAFSPGAKLIVTASSDKTAQVWDTATGRSISTLKHEKAVKSASFSPDGMCILTVSGDNSVHVWETATGQSLATLKHESQVESADFSSDGKRILTKSKNTSRVWDAYTGRAFGKDTGTDSAVFEQISELLTGRLLSREDEIQELTFEQSISVESKINEIAKSDSVIGQIVHWLITSGTDNRTGPNASIKFSDHLNMLLEQGDKLSLREARLLAPGHPLVLIGLADELCAHSDLEGKELAHATVSKQVEWLNDFAIQHIRNDAKSWNAAASMLADQGDVVRGEFALKKAELLDASVNTAAAKQKLLLTKLNRWMKEGMGKINQGEAEMVILEYEALQQASPLPDKMLDAALEMLTLAYCAVGRSPEVLGLHWPGWEPEVNAVRQASGTDHKELGALESKLQKVIRVGLHDKGFVSAAKVLYDALVATFKSEATKQPDNWRWPILMAWAYDRHAEAAAEEVGGSASDPDLYEQGLQARKTALQLLPNDSTIQGLIVSSQNNIQKTRLRLAIGADFPAVAQKEFIAVLTDARPVAVEGFLRNVRTAVQSEASASGVSEITEGWLTEIEQISKAVPTKAKEWEKARAVGLCLLATAASMEKRWPQAVEAARAYNEYAKTNLEANANDEHLTYEASNAGEQLARSLAGAGDVLGAVQAWTDAFHLWDDSTYKFRYTHQSVIQSRLAELAKQQGKPGQCIKCLRKSVALRLKTIAENPNWGRGYWALALAEAALAEALEEYGFSPSEVRQHASESRRNWVRFKAQPTNATAAERREDLIDEAWLSKTLQTVETSLTKTEEGQPPFAIWAKPGLVFSPFAGKDQLVDVQGKAAGSEVRCPYTNKFFRVPEKIQQSNQP